MYLFCNGKMIAMKRAIKKSLFYLFRQGFLSFFSLASDPIKKYAEEQKRISDADRIYSDWCNVGNDIRNAYEKYKQATAK